jgi:hypothetical protein
MVSNSAFDESAVRWTALSDKKNIMAAHMKQIVRQRIESRKSGKTYFLTRSWLGLLFALIVVPSSATWASAPSYGMFSILSCTLFVTIAATFERLHCTGLRRAHSIFSCNRPSASYSNHGTGTVSSITIVHCSSLRTSLHTGFGPSSF